MLTHFYTVKASPYSLTTSLRVTMCVCDE